MTDNITTFHPPVKDDPKTRKAKADGIRMARDYLWKNKNQFYSGLTELAMKVEKGETP